MKNKTKIIALLLMASGVVFATEYDMVVIDENGNSVSSCGTDQISTPIPYYDSNCTMQLATVVDGGAINVQLGPCPSTHKIKVVLDDHMYKFNVDAYIYKDIFNSDDVVSINAAISNCTGGTSGVSELQLYTSTDAIDLDSDYGMKWGHDSQNRPMLLLKSTTGNVVCNNPTSIVVNDDSDLIFKNGFNS